MSKFSLHEIAIIISTSPKYNEMLYAECEILSDLDDNDGYIIDVPGFTPQSRGKFYINRNCLRKKKPPMGCWEDVKEFCLWDPFKVTAPKEKQNV